MYGFINIWSGGRLLDDIEAKMPIPRTTIYEVKEEKIDGKKFAVHIRIRKTLPEATRRM